MRLPSLPISARKGPYRIPMHLAAAACLAAASGCASIEPALTASTQPDAANGYISGSFTRQSSGGFAFVIKNLQTDREYGLSLGENTWMPADVKDQVTTIKVPPGRYMVSGWYTYGTLTKEKTSTKKITNPYLSRPFEVSSNSVLYLGRFVASTTFQYPTTSWVIKPEKVTFNEAKDAFMLAHPLLKEVAFNCQLCMD